MIINESLKIEKLTKELIKINSVNNGKNKGETKVAQYIHSYFMKNEYFKSHPNQIIEFDSENNRHSIIAYLKGQSDNTIVLMGHIDTVEIDDYAKAKAYACDPDKIKNALKKYFDLSADVIKDMESNNYLFGRGSLDMKSGVAVNMTIIDYFSKHLDQLNGNLLFLAECDEEGDSKGIISALDQLIKLRKEENFHYCACINTDYSVSNDNKRYLYLGTVGKLLPSFICFGKESHVGSPFEGFDPNILLSILNKNLSLNAELSDKAGNKTSVPPICLKQSDFKTTYTVQTASCAYAYFNYMLYTSSPKKVLDKCLKIAKDSFKETIALINKNYQKYCTNNKMPHKKLSYKPIVYSFNEFDALLKKENSHYEEEMNKYCIEILKNKPDIDIREYSYKIVMKAHEYYKSKEPILIVYFGSTFYSNVLIKDKKIRKAIDKAVKEVSITSTYDIKTSDFYPFISDMSYLSCKHKQEDIKLMLANCPYYKHRYDYPYEKIKEIQMPSVNIGTFGFGGHTYVERVEKKYCFNELPNLILNTIINILK